MNHLTVEEILAYVDGTKAVTHRVENHINECPDCAHKIVTGLAAAAIADSQNLPPLSPDERVRYAAILHGDDRPDTNARTATPPDEPTPKSSIGAGLLGALGAGLGLGALRDLLEGHGHELTPALGEQDADNENEHDHNGTTHDTANHDAEHDGDSHGDGHHDESPFEDTTREGTIEDHDGHDHEHDIFNHEENGIEDHESHRDEVDHDHDDGHTHMDFDPHDDHGHHDDS